MILQHIILPMFEESFKSQQTDELIGGPPNPEHDSNTNVISVFVNKVIDPEHPFATNVSIVFDYFAGIFSEIHFCQKEIYDV